MKPDRENTYCHFPFKQITLKKWDSYGNLRVSNPCCQMSAATGKNLMIPNISEKNPDEIFNSDSFDKLRYDLINGIKNHNCKVCWDMEKGGLRSFRLDSFNKHDSEEKKLIQIDFTTSNLCNLRCRMCFPDCSHSLMIDEKKLSELNLKEKYQKSIFGDYSKKVVNNQNINSKQFEWMLNNTDKISILSCSGGEPFYDKKVLFLLKKFIEDGTSKNTILQFHTNATLFTDEIVEINNQFKSVSHTFSIDGVDLVYEYIRFHNFLSLEKSVLNFLSKSKNIDIIDVNLVLSSLNIFNISEFEEWVKIIFKSKNINYNINFSDVYPFNRGINIRRLPVSVLNIAKDKTKNKKVISLIDNSIKNNQENLKLLKDEIYCLDIVRNQSYINYLDPRIIQLINV